MLQGIETRSDLFDLAVGAKGVSVVDGFADGDPVGPGFFDGGVVAVLGLL